MAVYALADSQEPIRNGGAIGMAPADKSTQGFEVQGATETLTVNNGYASLIDNRFKVGGSTGWERPGSNLT